MADARYFIADDESLKDVYSKDDLRGLLQAGKLSRSDIVFDDETGLAHLLGDLLMSAYREARPEPVPGVTPAVDESPQHLEFRADTPLSRPESDLGSDLDPFVEGDEALAEDLFAYADSRADADEVEEKAEPGVEEVLYQGHPSWLAYPKSLFALVAFSFAAWLFHRLHAEFAWVIVSGSLAVLPMLFVSLVRTTTSYFITTRRVEVEFGMLGRSTREVRIADIRAIDVDQSGFNAIVGIGNVKFDSSAGPDAEVEFLHVRRPHGIKQAVRVLQG